MSFLVKEDELEETDEQVVIEEYKIWKKHCPFLYDTVITHVLEWPSLTVEWGSGRECNPNSDFSVQNLVLGTNTGGAEQDLLIVGKVKFPMEQSLISGKIYLDNTKDVGGIGLLSKTENKIEVNARVNHEREVLRARMMPKQEHFIACKGASGLISVYDMKKYTNKSNLNPMMTLTGHLKEGKALSWASHKPPYLASGALDGVVNVYDTTTGANSPVFSVQANESGVEEVAWNDAGILASVGRDHRILLWDLRQDSPATSVEGSTREIMAADFSTARAELLATAGKDRMVSVWDVRNLSGRVASFNSHKDSISAIKWEPYGGSLIASASWDRRVHIWDLARVSAAQTPEEAEDGPPELVFVHGGHTSVVSDIAWNPNENLTLASVAEDNILQVWQMSNSIFNY
jgi:histone-binding protein RBBP4